MRKRFNPLGRGPESLSSWLRPGSLEYPGPQSTPASATRATPSPRPQPCRLLPGRACRRPRPGPASLCLSLILYRLQPVSAGLGGAPPTMCWERRAPARRGPAWSARAGPRGSGPRKARAPPAGCRGWGSRKVTALPSRVAHPRRRLWGPWPDALIPSSARARVIPARSDPGT